MMYRHDSSNEWHKVAMQPRGNDRFRAVVPVCQLGSYRYTVAAWVDHLESWRQGLLKKHQAGQEIGLDLRTGALLAEHMAARAQGIDAQRLHEWAATLLDNKRDI